MRDFRRRNIDGDRLAWPILLLMLLVLVPSLGVVWLMREAIVNERLASSQRLREAYQAQLKAASQSVRQQWQDRLRQLDETIQSKPAAEAFASIVQQGFCDSVLIRDSEGMVLYPDRETTFLPPVRFESADWKSAESFEFTLANYSAAASAYAKISDETMNPVEQIHALRSQVRSLVKAGDQPAAIRVLEGHLSLADVLDVQGRSLAAAARLRLIELLKPGSSEQEKQIQQLADRLRDYSSHPLRSAQRRFLMQALGRLAEKPLAFPTQTAEEIAASIEGSEVDGLVSHVLRPTKLPEVWIQASPQGRAVVLFRTESLRGQILSLAEEVPVSSEVKFVLHLPHDEHSSLVADSLGSQWGELKLGLAPTGEDPFAGSSQERKAVLVWIALLVVGVTCVLAWSLASMLRRRLHLAQLKNDLVATVSHELKTPLASIRLLVDTLLEKKLDSHQINEREYLQLIGRENARLTRLIDNFLTFSRMERGKQRFDFQTLDLRDVVDQAANVFREHCEGADECLEVFNTADVSLWGDADGLVTAVLNLLENAWKYSGNGKKIVLSTRMTSGQVIVAVQDNGIGLSSRSAARVFDKFYQADQRVARTHGGCGLGLSIVRSIVRSHGGEVCVESELGRGSTFQILLPVVPSSAKSPLPLVRDEQT